MLRKLAHSLASAELAQFNAQIGAYMAEQLVHKAALNGNLAYACELVRAKYQQQQQQQQAAAGNCEASSGQQHYASAVGDSAVTGGDLAASNGAATTRRQDEAIFRLASELLVSDEHSLRKLSAQLLNEAQHVAQVHFALNTLRKLRWRHVTRGDGLCGVLDEARSVLRGEETEEEDGDQEDDHDDECGVEFEADEAACESSQPKSLVGQRDHQVECILEGKRNRTSRLVGSCCRLTV